MRLSHEHLLAAALRGFIAVCLGGLSAAATATPADAESTKLAVLARQIDATERIAREAAASTPPGAARYHLDYARLQADLQRIRTGIHDYLNPRRAQPRDSNLLWGSYTTDGRVAEPMP